jgi:hypothetical protein
MVGLFIVKAVAAENVTGHHAVENEIADIASD